MLLLRRMVDFYHFLATRRDPRTEGLPLAWSPLWPAGIVALYVWFVKYKGPELMQDRKPFNLRWVLVAFNAFQVVVNLYMFHLGMVKGYLAGYSLRCEPVDSSLSENAMQIANGCYLYYLVKIVDLLDTVFYVLRKRDRQISFLHVYHHGGMTIMTYFAVVYFPGGNSIFLGTINSFVHVVMYSYYLITALRPEHGHRLWWKKHLTQLQMVQFLLITLHSSQLIWEDCGYPRWAALILLPQNMFMLALFADFYRSAYLRPRDAQGCQPDKATGETLAQKEGGRGSALKED